MNPPLVRRSNGFTLIELVTVIAVAAILLTLAVPSFVTFFAGKRVEGVASELGTDLQYARSEAVSLKRNVRITFIGDKCYVIHRPDLLAVSSCVMTGAGLLKAVQLDASSSASLVDVPAFVDFEPVRGTATTSGAVTVGSNLGNARLLVSVSPVGRTLTCVPSGYALTGHSAC
jgi:type IV fimbrial biogenesis protein FimT